MVKFAILPGRPLLMVNLVYETRSVRIVLHVWKVTARIEFTPSCVRFAALL